MEISEKIKSLRLRQNMTQKELGELLDVSTVSIRHWESGTKNPSMFAIISLARIFRVSTDYILGVTSEEQDENNLVFTKAEQTLLANYRFLDKHGKQAVDTICAVEKARVESERRQRSVCTTLWRNTN